MITHLTTAFGWRWAFPIVGLFGVVITTALLLLLLRSRGQGAAGSRSSGFFAEFQEITRVRGVVHVMIAGTLRLARFALTIANFLSATLGSPLSPIYGGVLADHFGLALPLVWAGVFQLLTAPVLWGVAERHPVRCPGVGPRPRRHSRCGPDASRGPADTPAVSDYSGARLSLEWGEAWRQRRSRPADT